MPDDYAWMDSIGAAPAKAAPTKPATAKGGDPYAWMDQVAAPAPHAEPAEAPVAGLWDRFTSGVGRIAHTVAAGASAAGDVLSDLQNIPGNLVEAVKDPGRFTRGEFAEPAAKRRELLRGVDDMVTLGHGQRLAARIGNAMGDAPEVAVGPETFSGARVANTQEGDRAAAPGMREAGSLAGMFTPGAASALAKGGGQMVKLATAGIKPATALGRAGLGLVQGVGGYEASAPATAALSADAEGRRMEAAREAAVDPAGLALAGAGGAAAGGAEYLRETAPARVRERIVEDVTEGAGKKNARNVAGRAGADGEHLEALLRDDPALEKLLAVKAASAPAKVAKAVSEKSSQLTDELDGMYAAMEKAGRVVKPAEITASFDKAMGEALKSGDQDVINAMRKARTSFVDEFGSYGPMGAETLRGLKRTAARAAFAGDPAAPASAKAKVGQYVWGVFSEAIERQAAEAPGVDVARLKKLNRDVSTLIPIESALESKAANKGGVVERTVEALKHGGPAAMAALAGGAHGGSAEAVIAGIAAPVAIKAGKAAVRRADYAISKAAPSSVPEPGFVGARAGALDYASRVSQGMGNGLTLQQAVEAAKADE